MHLFSIEALVASAAALLALATPRAPQPRAHAAVIHMTATEPAVTRVFGECCFLVASQRFLLMMPRVHLGPAQWVGSRLA